MSAPHRLRERGRICDSIHQSVAILHFHRCFTSATIAMRFSFRDLRVQSPRQRACSAPLPMEETMKRTASILFLLLIVIACSTQKQAVLPITGSASVSGLVTADTVPLPGVTVTIGNTVAGSRTTTSDSNGVYRFVSIPAGQDTVRIEVSGMQTITRRIT